MWDSQILAFTLAAALLTIAPGADTMLVIRNVLRGGRRDGIVTSFGICSGHFIHATLSALGVSVFLLHSANAFHLLKLAGAFYLIWLGLQSLRSALRRPSPGHSEREAIEPTRAREAHRCFLEGLLSNVLNPKTAVFYLAFLPQFIGPTDPVFAKSMLLAGIHSVEGILWLGTLSITLDHTRRFILKSAVRRWLDGVCGAMLIGFGARLALERR
jgi:RhtB (resistance to homoserine/threonine) family protein